MLNDCTNSSYCQSKISVFFPSLSSQKCAVLGKILSLDLLVLRKYFPIETNRYAKSKLKTTLLFSILMRNDTVSKMKVIV